MPATIITLFLGIIIGFTVSHLIKNKKLSGIAKISEDRTSAKEENKDKIVEYLKEHAKARNNDLERLLGVSDTTTTRYLDELEKEGIVEQIGSTGRGVEYKLKNGPHE